jgi:hypothetical protein
MDVFLPFRHGGAEGPPTTEVRSTIVVSGIESIRSKGLHARYVEALSPETPAVRERFLTLVPGEWLPVELAFKHYAAADRMGIDPAVIDAIGAEVAERINKSVLSVAVTLSKRAGVTPWSALSLAHRINDINWRGGDVGVWKVGPKDAIYDWVGQPCASLPYFTTSFGGFLRALAALFSAKAYTAVVPERCSPTTISYRLSWV